MAITSEDQLRQALAPFAADPRYLFRGQNTVYTSVNSFIGRLTNSVEIGTSYTILRLLVGRLRGQIARIPQLVAPDADETIALMQHYGWPTPFLDLTDSLAVAFFFAAYKANMVGSSAIPNPAVIYVLDTTQLPSICRHVRHDDVVDPTLNLRWTRQRGHALAADGWPNMANVRILDLLSVPGLTTHPFQPSGYPSQAEVDNYLPPLDPVAHQLALLVDSLAQAMNFKPLPPVLARFPF
jgi:hypothetical protein